MNLNQNVPTVFAKSLAKNVDLFVEPSPGQNNREYMEKIERLKAFQQMAVTSTVEESMIAFYGIELTDMQIEALRIIYKSTKPWMLGHVVGVLLDRLDDRRSANKDFAESVRTIVDQLANQESGATKKLKGMLLKMSKD